MGRISQTLLFLIVAVTLLGLYLSVKDKLPFADEGGYFQTIQEIASGHITQATIVRSTVIPGYAAIIALFSSFFQPVTTQTARLITTILSSIALVIFYKLAKKEHAKNALVSTLQMLFLPIGFIFFSLIYTDIMSLLFVLTTFLFVKKRRFVVAGILGLISILMRQNNVLWLIFFCIYIFFTTTNFKRMTIKDLEIYLNNISFFLIDFSLLGIFILANHGIALDKSLQEVQPISFHTGNIFFALFSLFVLLLPLHIANIHSIISFIGKHKIYVLISLTIIFLLYIFTFQADHIWNGPHSTFFLRNKILQYMLTNYMIKALFFIPIAISLLSLAVIGFQEKLYYLMYPITLLFLGTEWLIEPRYYIVPFAFLLLFRKQKNPFIEYAILVVFAIISLYIVLGTLTGQFFL